MWKVGMGCKRARRILLGVAAGRERCRIRIGESRRTRIRGINWGLKIFGSVRRGNKESHPHNIHRHSLRSRRWGANHCKSQCFDVGYDVEELSRGVVGWKRLGGTGPRDPVFGDGGEKG